MTQDIKHQIESINKGLRWLNIHRRSHYEQRFLQLVDERRKLKKIEEAEQEKPAIAAFGESQKGKSHLIAHLLQKKDAPFLVTDKAGNRINFADGVTPIDGKREAKSVVTRFSTFKHRDDATERYSTAHPVVVKLLSVADIAAILCDSYHSDLLDKQFYADDEVKGIVDNIYSRYITLQEVPQAILTEDDILDIRAYLAKYVKDAQGLLKSGYFEKLALVIRRVPQNDWPEVLKPLWHGNAPITQLFCRLFEALRQLSFKREVYVDFDAVVHRGDNRNTIMSVDCLNGLDDKEWPFTTSVHLPSDGGFSVVSDFPKCELCALCAETIFRIGDEFIHEEDEYFYDSQHPDTPGYLPMTSLRKLPSTTVTKDLLGDTDLLDFPGMLNRLKVMEGALTNADAEGGASNLVQVFLRGKVAYLFNSYSERRLVNILVFCHDNEQPTVTEMHRILNDWVEHYVGKNPEMRLHTTKQCGGVPPFFVVGTKFNIDMAEKHNVDGDSEVALNGRWYGRFVKVLYTQIFKAESMEWFNNWDGAESTFKNTFLLRDFKHSGCNGPGSNLFTGYDENDPDSSEKGLFLSPEFYKRLRETFINNTDVRMFFADPTLAWDLATTMNNDGALYIISKLAIVSHRALQTRAEQFDNDLEEVRRRVFSIMKEYHVSDNTDMLLKENIRKANAIFREMEFTCQNDPGYFGHLLQALQLTETESYKMVHKLIPMLTSTVNDPTKIADYELIKKRVSNFDGCKTEADKWERILNTYGFHDKEEAASYLKAKGVDIQQLFRGETIKRKNSSIIAHDMLEMWMERITNVRFINNFSGPGMMDEIALDNLVNIIIATSRNVNLMQTIEDEITNYVDILNPSDINENLVADMIATTISDFVMDFGYRYLKKSQVQLFLREKKNHNIPCLNTDEQVRQEVFTEKEMTELFNTILNSSSRFTPAYEANYNSWLEYMFAAFIAHVKVPDYDREANDELQEIINMLKKP